MILDTSALLAILLDEPERRRFNELIEAADSTALSIANFVETSIVLEARFGAAGPRALDLLLGAAKVALVGVGLEQGRTARRAFAMYGKGRHLAALNFGDCFAYALAKTRGEGLLFKGSDFSQTDVMPVADPGA